jgi:hypothetical protein
MTIIGKDVELGRRGILGCRNSLAVAGIDGGILTGYEWITAQVALIQGYMTGDLRRILRRIAHGKLGFAG